MFPRPPKRPIESQCSVLPKRMSTDPVCDALASSVADRFLCLFATGAGVAQHAVDFEGRTREDSRARPMQLKFSAAVMNAGAAAVVLGVRVVDGSRVHFPLRPVTLYCSALSLGDQRRETESIVGAWTAAASLLYL